MQNISIVDGNIFRSTCQTLVNTVNCVGIMGAGIALEFRLRYPDMFAQYVQLCADGRLDVGRLWVYKAPERWVLNFPTKKHWKYPSKPQYLHQGLEKFVTTYEARGVTSAAFPLLGASHGGLAPEESLAIMQHYLGQCAIPIEIYRHDATAADDVFNSFKTLFVGLPDAAIAQQSGLRSDAVRRIRTALELPGICQLNQLAQVPGIGEKTLEKSFALMARSGDGSATAQAQASFGF